MLSPANLLSALRVLMAAIWIAACFNRDHRIGVMLGLAFGAAASDILDGAVARWRHTVSACGQWLDNGADIVFILSALGSEAYAGRVPAYIPLLIAASFAQYVLDSTLITGAEVPLRSRLGHWGGILNYVLVVFIASVPAGWLTTRLVVNLWRAVALFDMAAIFERVLAYPAGWRSRARRAISASF